MDTGQQIASVAQSQVGATSGWNYLMGNGSQAWCDDFVSWVLNKAGYQGYGHQAGVPDSEAWAQNHGLWHSAGSGYAPKVGDLVTFDWDHDGGGDHIGVVTGISKDGSFNVTSGNTDGYGKTGGESADAGAVATQTYTVNDGYVHGFIATSGGKTTGAGNTYSSPTIDAGPNANAVSQTLLSGLLTTSLGMDGLYNTANMLGDGGTQYGTNGSYAPSYGGVTDLTSISDPQTKSIIEEAKKVADKYGIPESVFLAVVDHETGGSFNPSSVGDQGTSFGLGQVHTPAHPDFNVQQALHGNSGSPDVEYQLEYSARMLKGLYDQYGSWDLAVEHYNGSGPQAQQYSANVMDLASKIKA